MSDGIQQLSTEAMIREEKRCNTSKVPEAYFSKVGGQPHLQDFNEYKQLYKESIDNPDKFWGRMCRELLTFDQDFTTVSKGTLSKGDVTWFSDGCLNATYNCVDRHAARTPEKPAIIFEADEPGTGRTVTYGDLLSSVCRLSLVLKEIGVKKGDTVSVYMPNIPEAIIAIFAISRIGAIHSLTFDGFSAKALSDRILDAGSKVVLTADQGRRGARAIEMKSVVDEALKVCPEVHTVLVYRHTGANVSWSQKRDIWWHEVIEKYPDFLEPEIMHSEDPLFVLYTSGSTGKPKGLVHSTAGFLVGAAATGKYVFDIHNDDVFFCGGDIGWITGLTYAVYAPLLLGCTTIVFEGSPLYPSITRYWDICDKHNVSQFYVAPTAIRLLKRVTGDHIRHSMENLRILASVGEPIAPEVWNWYHRVVGKGNSHVLDTYFQTETGSLVLTPLAGITPTKPGSCALPFFGVEPVILDPISGVECQDHNVEGVLAFKQPWPSMARTAWGDHPKYMDTYFKPYEGYYFTADRAQRDVDGYYWIMGRADDVVNVAAHRVSTAEVEAALLTNPTVAEAAVVGIDDNITGQALVAFVSLKNDNVAGDLKRELMERVSNTIGSFARPRVVHIVNDLPKTRSGKITRRILRNILSNQLDRIGDTSTLVNPTAIDSIAKVVYGSL